MIADDFKRLRELADRLVASGPKAAHVSASECHEISDGVRELIAEVENLRALAGARKRTKPIPNAGDRMTEESAVIQLLMDYFGWRFFDMPNERDRYASLVGTPPSGTGSMTRRARMVRVALPETSPLAIQMARITKDAERRKKRKERARKKKRAKRGARGASRRDAKQRADDRALARQINADRYGEIDPEEP